MNRVVMFGVAIFFAVVGIALLGGESKAVAGGCFGCNGCHVDAGCAAPACGGCHGLFGKHRCGGLFGKHRCHGRCGGLFHRRGCCAPADCCAPVDCCAPAPPACCGVVVEGEVHGEPAGDDLAPPPAPEASVKPYGFRQVAYRR